MKKLYAYCSAGCLLIAVSLTSSCRRTTDDSSDLVGNWTTVADFQGDTRSDAASFVIGDNAYVLTGTNIAANQRYADMYTFNLKTGNWSKSIPFPGAARNGAVAFTINGKGYIGSGVADQGVVLKDFWEFDPATSTWTQVGSLPVDADPRRDAAGFVIGSKGYVCGGTSTTKNFNDCWEFNPADADTSTQWQPRATMPHKTFAAATFVLNGKGYVISGNNNGTVIQEMYEFNADMNEWTTKRKLYNYSNDSYDDKYTTIARQNAVAFVMGGYGYLATGSNGSLTKNTWRYDATQDQWTEVTSFEATLREGAVAFTLGDRAFVLTGTSGNQAMDNAFEFHPGDAQVDGD